MVLTDEEVIKLWDSHTVPVFGKSGINPIVFAQLVESALLEKLKAQEPMCWMTPSGEGWMMRTEPPAIDTKLGWTALYEHPIPPDDVVRDSERYRWLRGQGYGGYAICKWDGGAGDYFRCIAPTEMIDAAIDKAMKEMK